MKRPAKSQGRTGAAPASPRGTSRAARTRRAAEVVARLRRAYPDAQCSLHYRTPFQLLVSTILSAQCTDERVNAVTPALFALYPEAESLAGASIEHVEELIRSTGFFRSKAKNIVGMAHALVERHGGEVPATMEELVRLPGVGRKTANVVLGNAFGRDEGVVVDTHVGRLSARLGLSAESDPVKVEQDLMATVPREHWTLLPHLLIDHGRQICVARKPRCGMCVLNDICPSAEVITPSGPRRRQSRGARAPRSG